MSVDHYDCSCCSRTGVYEEYIGWCNKCSAKICDECLINVDYENGDKVYNDDGYIREECCPFCSGDKISDSHRVYELFKILRCSGIMITPEEVDKSIIEGRKKK